MNKLSKMAGVLLMLSLSLASWETTMAHTAYDELAISSDYATELSKLNAYLKDASDGFYGYFEVKDGFIYVRFKEGKYSKFNMQDMADPVIGKYGQLHFDCKGEKYCIETDWNDEGKETGLLFSDDGTFSLEELYDLLINFKSAYLSAK